MFWCIVSISNTQNPRLFTTAVETRYPALDPASRARDSGQRSWGLGLQTVMQQLDYFHFFCRLLLSSLSDSHLCTDQFVMIC
ncbi:hypothetical protein RRG08_017608 [Elysia crispata]|uniref:Uncharacterized protein n=1 Tax=Elysia crispata TaxID=231223 RepID=A0AAE0YZ17_9GAST|nr:hypothetical protein RRG08_017608 [Elysia crispata]